MNQHKRVLVIDNLAVESSRRSLYRIMAEAFDVHLLVPHRWKETTFVVPCEPEDQSSLTIHRTGILFGFRHHRVMYRGLFRILREIRPDFILAVHAPENYATLELLLARKLVRPQVKIGLFASRNIDLPSMGFPYRLAFLNTLCDEITAKLKVDVVFQRPGGYAHLYQRYTGQAVYIPHNVDCTDFTPDRSRLPGPSAEPVIGYVGRLIEAKGVHLLIEALAEIPVRARLWVTGEGPYRARLEALAVRHGVSDRVIFGPLVPYAGMPRLMSSFDVLVLPSLETAQWKELFGRVLIEAMACGVPVLASDSGGIPEVVGDAGMLFRTGDLGDLKQKLSGILARPEVRADAAKRGRQRVLENFDTRVVARRLISEISRALDA